jgi:hypothetical protein
MVHWRTKQNGGLVSPLGRIYVKFSNVRAQYIKGDLKERI